MKTMVVWRGGGLALGTALLLALSGGVAVADEDGAAGSVKSGTETAGDSTKRGLTRAGEAVGEALDTAITKTGKGVSRALESTGDGIQRAGRAVSGEPEPAHEEPTPEVVPEHPIHEEPLDE
jgi:hypothetical protein